MKPLCIILFVIAAAIVVGCTDPDVPITLDETPYPVRFEDLPEPILPTDYPLTQTRVSLGRTLFHDGQLSRTGTQSCATCHSQAAAFSDNRKYSIGVRGLPGTRQAMALVNLAWSDRGFFWDGRSPTLRDQALHPIVDTLEMDETLDNVVRKLSTSSMYRSMFTRAFGSDSITPERIGIALEQFMLILISGQSKYDRALAGYAVLSETEERGRQLFMREFDPTYKKKGAECFHCHAAPFFTNDRFMNNGLDDDAMFLDLGRERVTGLASDRAKFRVPTLRNIARTAPYMHDGRFKTLEEVVDFYNIGVRRSSTVDALMQFNLAPGLKLDAQDKADLVAFLKTLTDEQFLTNPLYRMP
ncbi:MAG: c-type cytochrome [Candidatus Kapabacteria bacterium]|nr:c-type cytochrome [Candidatus Kapabacteria bacterium]